MEIKDTESIQPLSPLQEAILLETCAPHLACGQIVCRLKGPINSNGLECAARTATQRHPILRTFFLWKRVDKPLQVIRSQGRVNVDYSDWTELSEDKREEELQTLSRDDRERGIDPGRAPLFRLSLCETGSELHVLVLTYHRTILDRRTSRLFVRELLHLYAGDQRVSQGSSNYDGIAWVKGLQGAHTEDFWRENLKNLVSPTSLTMARSSTISPEEPMSFAEATLRLPSDLVDRLEMVVGETGLRVATLLHAAWGLLLSRYSGDQDVVFGTCVESYPASQAESGIALGPFSYALPIRVSLSDSITVCAWLETIEANLSSIRRHSNISLARITKLAGFNAGAALFESCVDALDKSNLLEPVKHGAVTLDEVRDSSQDYPLIVTGDLNSGSLRICFDRRRFEEGSIDQVLKHLEILLQGIVANLNRALSAATLLTPAAERQLLRDWNSEPIQYSEDRCIQALFEEQVEKTPEIVAVEFDGKRLTYRELNERANRLAHYLQSLGVGPEVLVGIFMDRSLDMIVALLSIIKSGGRGYHSIPVTPSIDWHSCWKPRSRRFC